KELAALEKEEPYTNNVGFSERADVPIEPRLSEQWFLKYPGVEQAQSCVEQSDIGGANSTSPTSNQGVAELCPPNDGKMRFHPQRWAKVYDHWLTNIQDWCISRQLWWGHRIPIWSASFSGELKNKVSSQIARLLNDENLREGISVSFTDNEDSETFVCYGTEKGNSLRNEDLEKQIFAATISELEIQELEKLGFTQDPDVLDTWFSSWLWPFATMGWTNDKTQDSNNPTLQAFYPTTDLVTGPDIIFFWVARMIMAGYEFMGEMPFKNVYFTGIIRDKQGRKMSKSLGNSPDPLDLIGKYGADALRFGTMRSAPLGQDILFDEQNVELGRNFCNKLWNACRFRQ
ncbi:MAG TPA: class I tRNA ligase family protein, partial [Verrucomicrobiae bacterium]|nr:class I tRNA ligase family protein [Verrucomicrobiae bacterium]